MIQLWFFLPYTFGKPGENREHKVVARHFLAEIQEAYMAVPRDIFKRLTAHGKGKDGMGFDETEVSFWPLALQVLLLLSLLTAAGIGHRW